MAKEYDKLNNKISIPTIFLLTCFILPFLMLTYLLVTSTSKISSNLKQIISIPFILTLIIIPTKFTSNDLQTDILLSTIGMASFLKYLDIFFVDPFAFNHNKN